VRGSACTGYKKNLTGSGPPRYVSFHRNNARFLMNKLREISRVLADTDDERLIEEFLVSLLTRYEIDEISSRWELVKLLHGGMTQRSIARRLGLSLCKITRGSRELKRDNSPFKIMIERYWKNMKKHPSSITRGKKS
jgi:TrpR family trp operon transcriptional repressor